jgi:hypothetical protein
MSTDVISVNVNDTYTPQITEISTLKFFIVLHFAFHFGRSDSILPTKHILFHTTAKNGKFWSLSVPDKLQVGVLDSLPELDQLLGLLWQRFYNVNKLPIRTTKYRKREHKQKKPINPTPQQSKYLQNIK